MAAKYQFVENQQEAIGPCGKKIRMFYRKL